MISKKTLLKLAPTWAITWFLCEVVFYFMAVFDWRDEQEIARARKINSCSDTAKVSREKLWALCAEADATLARSPHGEAIRQLANRYKMGSIVVFFGDSFGVILMILAMIAIVIMLVGLARVVEKKAEFHSSNSLLTRRR